jgi:hypothetical protein
MSSITKNRAFSLLSAATLAVSFGSASLAQANELMMPDAFKVNLDWSLPYDNDNWDGGLGIRVQALLPATIGGDSDSYHFGLSLGVSSWDANEDLFTASSAAAGVPTNGTLTGDFRSVNLGAAVVRTDLLDNGIELATELGLVYSSISSDAQIVYQNTAIATQEVELDNVFSAVIAVDANFTLSEELSAFGGIGYQFDLSDADATIATDIDENSTNAFFLRGGVRF